MHTKNHENCSQIECFIRQKTLAPKFLSQTVPVPHMVFSSYMSLTLDNDLVQNPYLEKGTMSDVSDQNKGT